ncbi:hypothetical protein DSM106972_040510 [Dulcicalothrix desertica PCC 7102]|uniref:Secreted protein n=1 Tax=Dulcicalothrix desertica PCC 7102 TaxID=232991 RepID=A0A3S1D842_9CYAN|nr:hypothetical protein [Dulcicalothrix desertica]RUT05230.1 hypothetical protein DSM106972_040510 [Dulcicalothrix desertica PCC 7102]TWH43267.1 hypothetical protein CAL7102_06975 [Dulcicalothrix desertica PCC 7102]
MLHFTKAFVCLVVLITFNSPAFARSKPRAKYGYPRVTTREIPNCYMITKDRTKLNLARLCGETVPAQQIGTNTSPPTPVKK